MLEYNKSIFLEKSQEDISFLITMFSILSEATSAKELTFQGNQVTIRQRSSSEIIVLNRDIEALKTKILDWFDAKTNPLALVLNEQEADLLKYCAHAAHYFLTEKEAEALAHQDFIDFYLRHFKQD